MLVESIWDATGLLYYLIALWKDRDDTGIPVGYWSWYLLFFTSFKLYVITLPKSDPTAIVDPSEQNAIAVNVSYFYRVTI